MWIQIDIQFIITWASTTSWVNGTKIETLLTASVVRLWLSIVYVGNIYKFQSNIAQQLFWSYIILKKHIKKYTMQLHYLSLVEIVDDI